ncbi:MAG: sel1 repeat family protein, partial [Pseudomonadota bacterium]|nr:sel1 repeat family protein [Pseudomonadota bacterium]
MKKTLISTFLFGLISIQAHADYVTQPQSVAAQAARYSVMGIDELQRASKAGQAGAQFYLATRYQYAKDVAKDEKQAFSLF